MKSVFIIKDRNSLGFMVVITDSKGTTFKPLTQPARDLTKFLEDEYSATQISKTELIQAMDSSMSIEGPSPYNSATMKKISLLDKAPKEEKSVEVLRAVEVISISEISLNEFTSDEFMNVVRFKAASFIADQTQSSIGYEIKGVRAIWDPSLSIPGTNRRGGWRCPVGTRYGGQITDRFGRQCGWGVARRIANSISDLGHRLERIDDHRRNRRLERRNRQMVEHLAGGGTGRVERGLRGIADRLDNGDNGAKPSRKPMFDRPRIGGRRAIGAGQGNQQNDIVPAQQRVRRQAVPGQLREKPIATVLQPESARDQGLRPSERRRVRREIVNPGAARTGEGRQPNPRPRPQQQPRVQPRVVQPVEPKLTAQQAGDAQLSEDFGGYVNRKYGEYAQNVRQIRENGGNAGMLTRREWYTINKENLRGAWGDVHGREAPQDFNPPTPRRPRNNRANRRGGAVQQVQKTTTRKPQANDVPEPAPAKPARPAKRVKTPAPQAVQKASSEPRINLNSKWNQNDNGLWERNGYELEPFFKTNGKLDKIILRAPDGQTYEQGYGGRHTDTDINNFAEFIYGLAGGADADTSLLRGDTPTPPEPPTPRTPQRAPSVPKAQEKNKKSPIRKFFRDKNAHGKLKINRDQAAIGKFVVEADPKINTAEKAIEHVKNGGDLQKVPAEFMHIAIEANSSSAVVDRATRFKKISPNGGAIGVTRIYHLRESNGEAGNQGWVFKAAKPYDNVGELVGWNYLAAVGILEDGAIQDGKLEMDVRKPGGTIKKGTPYIIIPLAHNDVPQGAKISPAVGGYDFVARDLNALPDKAFPERFGNLLANFVLGVSDRHAGNGMGRVVEMQDGKKLAHVVPLDLGWAGKAHGRDFGRYANDVFYMDTNLIGQMRRELPNMPMAQRREVYAKIQDTYAHIVTETAKVLSQNREAFIKDALKNASKGVTNKERAGKLYDGMTAALVQLRGIEQQIKNILPANQR